VSERRYPKAPIVGVGAVILDRERRVLLVKRAFEPSAQRWSLPGGGLEIGERLRDACAREVREECGLEVEVGPQVLTYDMIDRDEAGQVRYHFIIVAFLTEVRAGELRPNAEVLEARWVPHEALADYELTRSARLAIEEAFRLTSEPGWSLSSQGLEARALFRTNE